MARYDLLIFDWDGTLVDSIGRIVTSIRRAAESCGLAQRSEEEIRGIIGLAMPQVVGVLYPDLVEESRAAEFQRVYAEHYLTLEAEPSAFYPGVLGGLSRLRVAGCRLAVATGKSRRGLQRVMDGHGCHGWFDITRCADETASKPDPLMLNEILAHCRVAPERAVMVGDSLFDLHMAARARMDAVAVSYGAQPGEALAAVAPRHMVGRFDELVDWLLQ